MTFDRAVQLLKEFDYEKNGEQSTVEFLIWILNQLMKGEE